MLTNQSKIQKHKAHIERRISELENKLREPIRENQASNKKIDDQELPYRRAYAQQQVYVEPKEVTALRERQINGKESRSRKTQHPSISDPQLFIQDPYMKNSQRVSNQRIWNKQPENKESFNISNTQQIYYPKKQERNSIIRQKQGSQQNSELYGLMEQILNNQRNLQKQIGLLRSEWVRQQTLRKEERLAETINSKIRSSQAKVNPIISFQQPQSMQRPQIFEIFNKKPVQEHARRESQRRQIQANENFRNTNLTRKNQQSYEQQTFGVNSSNQEPRMEQTRLSPAQQIKGNKQSTAHKNRKSTKKVQEQQIQQKLTNLIKTQKGKSERLVVTEKCKSEFWRQVENRIVASEKQYKESVHRNNRHENDHLINTNELQKKIKDDLISKVYSQCNNCLYK